MGYDMEEASYLMDVANGAAGSETAARDEAARELLRAIAETAAGLEFRALWDQKRAGLWVSVTGRPNDGCYVVIDGTGTPAIEGPEGGDVQPIRGLAFSSVNKRWEGMQRDRFRNPSPDHAGKPVRRRDAAAIVIEAALGRIMGVPTSEAE
jgi:hypothetical protein